MEEEVQDRDRTFELHGHNRRVQAEEEDEEDEVLEEQRHLNDTFQVVALILTLVNEKEHHAYEVDLDQALTFEHA